jgi:hypothetical protein
MIDVLHLTLPLAAIDSHSSETGGLVPSRQEREDELLNIF